jgi:hypothetical protein
VIRVGLVGGIAARWRILGNVMDVSLADTSVPRARQLRDEQQSGRNPTREYQQRQPSLKRGAADQTDLNQIVEEHESNNDETGLVCSIDN